MSPEEIIRKHFDLVGVGFRAVEDAISVYHEEPIRYEINSYMSFLQFGLKCKVDLMRRLYNEKAL